MNDKKVTDSNHEHKSGDVCSLERAFGQLYGGGQGVYGATAHDGVKIVTPLYTVTYMKGSVVDQMVYVTDNSQAYTLKAAGSGMQWIDNEGRGTTSIPAGNTKNVVVYLDEVAKFIAYFVDKDGVVIYSEAFTTANPVLQNAPAEPPAIAGYTGKWEHYDLKTATGSIIIKPYYTLSESAEELYELDINLLFQWISEGKTVVMTQELEGSQSNASKADCAVITNAQNPVLNLNGYTLEYAFNSNANKSWLIFDIRGGSSLTISGGINHGGKLIMKLGSLNGNARPVLFDLEEGDKLILEKGTTIELHYPSGRGDDVSMFGKNGTQFAINREEYPYLEYTHDTTNCIKRLVVKETTVIVG